MPRPHLGVFVSPKTDQKLGIRTIVFAEFSSSTLKRSNTLKRPVTEITPRFTSNLRMRTGQTRDVNDVNVFKSLHFRRPLT